MITKKRCSICRETKYTHYFLSDSTKPDGLTIRCIGCAETYARKMKAKQLAKDLLNRPNVYPTVPQQWFSALESV